MTSDLDAELTVLRTQIQQERDRQAEDSRKAAAERAEGEGEGHALAQSFVTKALGIGLEPTVTLYERRYRREWNLRGHWGGSGRLYVQESNYKEMVYEAKEVCRAWHIGPTVADDLYSGPGCPAHRECVAVDPLMIDTEGYIVELETTEISRQETEIRENFQHGKRIIEFADRVRRSPLNAKLIMNFDGREGSNHLKISKVLAIVLIDAEREKLTSE